MVAPATGTFNSPAFSIAPSEGMPISDEVAKFDAEQREAFGNHAAALKSLQQNASKAVTPDLLGRCALMSADLIAAAIGLFAMIAAFHSIVATLADGIAVVMIIPTCMVLGLYDRDSNVLSKTTMEEVPRLLCAAMIVTTTTIALRNGFGGGQRQIDTYQLLFMSFAMFGLMCMTRMAARALVSKAGAPEKLLVIGTDSDCNRLANAIASTPAIKATIASHLSTDLPCGTNGLPREIDSPEKLQNTLEQLAIDRVVIATSGKTASGGDGLIRAISATGVKVSLQPRMFGSTRAVPVIESVGSIKLVNLRQPRLSPAAQRTKRLLDACGASVALVLASPFIAAIAVAIKLDSRGPVFYRQTRIGLDGEPFEIVKFRTMRIGAEQQKQELMHLNETDGLFKISADPRVTRVGRMLRRTSIDELPQLFNVVRGEMSLVGPRPLVPEEDCLITGWRRHRNTITPGMTGVWQLLGPVRIPIDEMVEIDYEYVANWSLGTDVKIMLQTVPHVLGRRGL